MSTQPEHKPLPDCLTPSEAQSWIAERGALLIDVREPGEFAGKHAKGAVNYPFSTLATQKDDIRRRGGGNRIVCICASGHRSQSAAESLRASGEVSVANVQGGTKAWQAAGLPMVIVREVMPLEQQVRLVAGIMVSGFSLAGFWVAPAFHIGAALVGFLLFLTASLGICPMLSLLQQMPWNRAPAA